MQSFSAPLNQLHEDSSWFARAHEIKLFVVRTSGDIRKAALKFLAGLEFHADNFSPWILLEDPYTKENDGWIYRSNRLVKDWERRREAFAKEKVELPEVQVAMEKGIPPKVYLNPSDFHKAMERSPGLAVFYHTIIEVIRALRPPLKGIVLMLAPSMVDTPEKLEGELELLLTAEDLDTCRIVLVIDQELQHPQRLFDVLKDKGLFCECVVDQKKYANELKGMMVGENNEDEVNVMSGVGAFPRGVIPPKRIDAPPELPTEERDEALLKAGINPEFLNQSPLFRKLVFGAAFAFKDGDMSEAIRQQLEATMLCSQLEMYELEVTCRITLANYLSGIGQINIAIQELEEAVACATQNNLPNVQSQAHLALGLLHSQEKKYPQSANDYACAARTAESAQIDLLAIEAWRMSGQMSLQAGNEEDTILSFQEAIRVAGDTDEQTLKASSAPEAARQFAVFCQKRGFNAQAESLFSQADQMEQGDNNFDPVDLPLPTDTKTS